jgi:hypothetical protein
MEKVISLRKDFESLNKAIKITEEVWVEKWGLDAKGYAIILRVDNKSKYLGS